MGFQAVIVYPDGKVESKELADWEGIKQELNNGYIEVVPVGDGFALYVDEEGIMKGLLSNHLATDVAVEMLKKSGRMLLGGIKGVGVFVGQKHTDDGIVECDFPETVFNEYFND